MALEKLIDWHINKLLPLQNNRGYEILQSFPGIAKWSASVLLIEIGNVERFASAKELASYFGLNPKFKQSGDGLSKSVMSKQGRSEPRNILYMVALAGIRCNPILKRVYEKHTAKGMKGAAAIGVCMHKAIRIIYGMLKNNTMFDPNIDDYYQQRSVSRKEVEQGINNGDVNAPISRRQYKEIKAGVSTKKHNYF